METVIKDLRYALRTLVKKPVFAGVTLLVLALGIGANTAIFSVVNAVLIKPLPFKDADGIVALWEHKASIQQGRKFRPDFLEYQEWNAQATSFSGMAGFRIAGYSMTGEGDPEQIKGASVTPAFFDLLGVPASYGRTFSEADVNGPALVVLGHSLWKRRFGSSLQVLGKAINLNSKPYVITGVMPPGLEIQDKDAELWTMITPTDEYFSAYQGMHILQTIARLRPGVAPVEAQAEMNVLQRQVDLKHPDGVVDSSITVTRLQDDLSGPSRPALLVLVGVVAFVLLIACANVANLLLGRASERRKEVAIRTALGGGRRRLVRQMLTESILIFALGGALGSALAWFALGIVVSSNPFRLPRVDQIEIDPVVLGFAAILSLTTGLLFGLIPALQAPKVNVSDLLKDEARSSSSSSRSRRARNALVVVEIALSMILLVGAGLMTATLRHLASVPVGIDPDGVLTMRIEMGKTNYPDAARRVQFVDQVMQKVTTLPGVTSAAFASNLPLTGVLTDRISIEGRPAPARSDIILVGKEAVTPDFFRTLGVRLINGRELEDSDSETTRLVTVINQEMAARIFPSEDPVGKRIKHGDPNDPYSWMEVVGVVSDVRQLPAEAGNTPVMFMPYPQVTADYVGILARNMSLVVRSATGPDSAYPSIRSAIWSLDHDMPVSNVMSMNTLISESVQEPRVRAALVGTFAALALILAAVGLYGVVSQSVLQRRYELGIRMALGAAQSRIRLMVLKEGIALALIGILIGAFGALFVTRLLRGLLFGVAPNDPVIFVLVSAILLVVAAAATYFPAHRATRSDPLAALRAG